MVVNRNDDGTLAPEDLNRGNGEEGGANPAVLTMDEADGAPQGENIDGANANNNQAPPAARAADGSEYKVWNGMWASPVGRKVAKYLMKDAGSFQDQKEKTQQLYNYLTLPGAHMSVIGADTSPVAYLLHVAGTGKLRVLYGLSPAAESSLASVNPKAFRALMRDMPEESDTSDPRGNAATWRCRETGDGHNPLCAPHQ